MARSYIFSILLRFTIQMHPSYNTHIGKAANEGVNISNVGVITAATISIIIMACLWTKYGLKPNLHKIQNK